MNAAEQRVTDFVYGTISPEENHTYTGLATRVAGAALKGVSCECKYLCNAFSLQMLAQSASMRMQMLTREEAKLILKINPAMVSAVGHADTMAVINTDLGCSFESNRVSVKITTGESVLVAQYSGSRLPEGCKTLPEDGTLQYWLVSIAE